MSLRDWSAADVAAKLSGTGRSKAKKTSRGWMVCCPAHQDRTPSLSIADGRDGVLLYHCFGGCMAEDVRAAIENELGVASGGAAVPARPRPKRVVEKEEDDLEIVSPVPEKRSSPTLDDFHHFEHGNPSKVWTYRLADGSVSGWVARYDLGEGDKEIIPWSWTHSRKTGEERLRMRAPASPRPLYNLDLIEDSPDAPVMWNEGEKAADAAAKMFPNWVATTCQGGGNAVTMADLRPLHGRIVIILCDHDGPGYGTGAKLVSLLHGRARLFFMRWPAERPDGSKYEMADKDDAADHASREWTAQDLRDLREKGVPMLLPIREIAPAFDVIHYDRQSERRFTA